MEAKMRYKLSRGAHSVYALHYHLVLVTKYRRKVFDGAIVERLKDIFYNIGQKFGVEILMQEPNKDHIHILFAAKPTTELTKFINALKGASANRLFHEFPELKKKLWGGHLWGQSYCLLTTGQVSLDVLKKYVESQGEH
jgi:putative transposase